MRVRGLRRRDNSIQIPIRSAIGDVISHRVVEEKRVLGDDADLRAQRSNRQVTYVNAVERDPTCADVVKPRDQVDQRAFPHSAHPD